VEGVKMRTGTRAFLDGLAGLIDYERLDAERAELRRALALCEEYGRGGDEPTTRAEAARLIAALILGNRERP
jgi:hypothetical protein